MANETNDTSMTAEDKLKSILAYLDEFDCIDGSREQPLVDYDHCNKESKTDQRIKKSSPVAQSRGIFRTNNNFEKENISEQKHNCLSQLNNEKVTGESMRSSLYNGTKKYVLCERSTFQQTQSATVEDVTKCTKYESGVEDNNHVNDGKECNRKSWIWDKDDAMLNSNLIKSEKLLSFGDLKPNYFGRGKHKSHHVDKYKNNLSQCVVDHDLSDTECKQMQHRLVEVEADCDNLQNDLNQMQDDITNELTELQKTWNKTLNEKKRKLESVR